MNATLEFQFLFRCLEKFDKWLRRTNLWPPVLSPLCDLRVPKRKVSFEQPTVSFQDILLCPTESRILKFLHRHFLRDLRMKFWIKSTAFIHFAKSECATRSWRMSVISRATEFCLGQELRPSEGVYSRGSAALGFGGCTGNFITRVLRERHLLVGKAREIARGFLCRVTQDVNGDFKGYR